MGKLGEVLLHLICPVATLLAYSLHKLIDKQRHYGRQKLLTHKFHSKDVNFVAILFMEKLHWLGSVAKPEDGMRK